MKNKQDIIVGVDEAGRGPLAGPVIAAAVILDEEKPIPGLTDSKQLTAKERAVFFELIKERALAWAVGRAEVVEIDRINILQATLLAMRRAVLALSIQPTLALVDGNQDPRLNCKTQTIIKGDETQSSISAASIVAKVTRDLEMESLALDYPLYQFEKHKGYATSEHLILLKKYGPCSIHRKSFAPVALFF